MHRRRTHALTLVLGLMTLVGLAGVSPIVAVADAGASGRQNVRIGVIIPLTGGNAYAGEDIVNLLSILEERLNQRSKRYQYKFVVEDGHCGVGNAAAGAANKFIFVDQVKFLIVGCSGEALIAGPLAQRAGVLMFVVFGSHKDIRTLGDYVFRTFVDIERSIRRFSSYIKDRETGSIALLTEESAFTKNIESLLQQYLGSKIVYSEEFALDSSDFSTLLEKARAKNAGAIFVTAASTGTLSAIVNQAASRKIDIPFYSYLYPELAGFVEATRDRSAGLTFLGAPRLNESFSELMQVEAEFEKRYGKKQNFDLVFGAAFDAVQAMTDGIEVEGPDAAKVKEYLKTYRKPGALGTVMFDENGDIKQINFALKRIERGGKIVLIDPLNEE